MLFLFTRAFRAIAQLSEAAYLHKHHPPHLLKMWSSFHLTYSPQNVMIQYYIHELTKIKIPREKAWEERRQHRILHYNGLLHCGGSVGPVRPDVSGSSVRTAVPAHMHTAPHLSSVDATKYNSLVPFGPQHACQRSQWYPPLDTRHLCSYTVIFSSGF